MAIGVLRAGVSDFARTELAIDLACESGSSPVI